MRLFGLKSHHIIGFQNRAISDMTGATVLYPCEINRFQNTFDDPSQMFEFCTLAKSTGSKTPTQDLRKGSRFVPLRNQQVLKLYIFCCRAPLSFVPLRNQQVLKPQICDLQGSGGVRPFLPGRGTGGFPLAFSDFRPGTTIRPSDYYI